MAVILVCGRVVLFVLIEVLSHDHVLTSLGGRRILSVVELVHAVVLLKAIVWSGLLCVEDDLGWLLATTLCEHDRRKHGGRRGHRIFFRLCWLLLIFLCHSFDRFRRRLSDFWSETHALKVFVRRVASKVRLLNLQRLVDIGNLLGAVLVDMIAAVDPCSQMSRFTIQERSSSNLRRALIARPRNE